MGCWTSKSSAWNERSNEEGRDLEVPHVNKTSCCLWRKLCYALCCLFRSCFCRCNTAAQIKPESILLLPINSQLTNPKSEEVVDVNGGGGGGDCSSVTSPLVIYSSVTLKDELCACSDQERILVSSRQVQKFQTRRPGTPRQHIAPQLPDSEGCSYTQTQCFEEVFIEPELIGDNLQSIEEESECPDEDVGSKGNAGDILSQVPSEPITLVIGPDPVRPGEVRGYLQPKVIFELLVIEFDLRRDLPSYMTPDSIFEILQMAFLHPCVNEFRVRIDNWRNYIHQKENVLPEADGAIGPQIRTSYPMNLNTLICYCPGITLNHLLVWQGFLMSQDNLDTLICNFDSVEWVFYKPILRKLKGTLRKLELYSITNHNGNIDDILPFDWLVLSKFTNLTTLKLWGDTRYYGLRHTNLGNWNLNNLAEIELKYVDLGVKDISHFLLKSINLRLVNLQYFTPIPIPITAIPEREFIQTVAYALAEQRLQVLSFTDYKLPGSIQDRQHFLKGFGLKQGYTSIWSLPDDTTADLMEFQYVPSTLH